MIASFANKHLATLFTTGKSAKLDARLHSRILRRLDALKNATKPEDLNIPGFNFHSLNSFAPTRYTIHVNGPWCITFAFANGDAVNVNFEQYH